jgi:hypothetical protein
VDLDGNGVRPRPIVEHEVDHAADRAIDGYLGRDAPPGMKGCDEGLADGDLDSIPDARPGVRVQTHREVGAQGVRDGQQDGDARLGRPRLDPRQVRLVDPSRPRDGGLGSASIVAHRV